MLFTNKRFKDVRERAQQYIAAEHAQQSRGDYTSGIAHLSRWLDASEALLRERLECEHTQVREHLLRLEDAMNEERDVEEKFKATSKTAQTLVKNSPQATIQEMLQELKVCSTSFFLMVFDLETLHDTWNGT